LIGLCGWLVAASACLPSRSLLEKGEKVETGKGRYDAYFGQVAELRDKVKALDSDLFPIRQPLTEEFHLDVDAPLPRIVEETKKRAEKMKSFGVLLGLRLTPTPVVVVIQGELKGEDGDDGALKAVQEAAVRSLATYREYQELVRLADKLDEERAQLAEGLDKIEAEEEKALVENEILGAGRVLTEIRNKLVKDERTCALFLVALADAIETGATEQHEESCTDAMAHYKPPKKPGKGPARGAPAAATRWRPPPGAGRPAAPPVARPAGPVAAPPPPAAPRPKPGGDFDM
jgi:hypothetical protein